MTGLVVPVPGCGLWVFPLLVEQEFLILWGLLGHYLVCTRYAFSVLVRFSMTTGHLSCSAEKLNLLESKL